MVLGYVEWTLDRSPGVFFYWPLAVNKSWNFWFWKCLFGVLTPIFQLKRSSNFMKTYMELVLVLDDLQPESRLSALRFRLDIIKTILPVGKKNGFFKFWAPKFCPILTIFLLNNKYTSIHVHICFCNSTLRISSGF